MTEYEQRQGWVTTGIIAGTLLPLIVVILLVYICYFHDNSEKKSAASWKYFQNRSTYRKSPQTSLLSSQPKSDESDNSSPQNGTKHRRQYDKVYRTHEPLPGKPNVDFSDRDENLKDVDDEDIKKFRDSCYYGSESASKSGSFVSATADPNDLKSILESSSESSKQDAKNTVPTDSESEISEEDIRPNVEKNAYSSESHEATDSDDGPRYERIDDKSTSGSSAKTDSLYRRDKNPKSFSNRETAVVGGRDSSPSKARYSGRPKSKISSSSSERPKISTSSTASSSKGSAIQTPI